MPTDPVCGIEMDEQLATPYEHQGKMYYFCCEGCKRIFIRKPTKYL
jgi:YHS domain-containing protein